MWQFVQSIFFPHRYIPHGHCYLWQTSLVGLHVVSDLLIAIAYFSIPAMLIYFVYRQKNVPFSRVFVLFGLFIISCGVGHLMDIYTLWYPAYWLSGIERAFTALISCYTALELATLLPRFLSLKTPEQLAAVEAVSQAKSRFLASMSHELRTPLNSILGFTQLVAGDTNLSSQSLGFIHTINQSGKHLLSLINDVLDFSKIDAGYIDLRKRDTDLYSLIESVKELFQLKATVKNLQLIFQIEPGLPRFVQVDDSRLWQVLINLVGNAVKFTKAGTVTLQVELHPTQLAETPDTQWISFRVKDTGPGIPLNEQSRLFEAFYQTEIGVNSQQGTGLGLSISQRLVQLMGGEIQINSRLGRGSCFTFSIPVMSSVRSQLQAAAKQIIGILAEQPKPRILIADDNTNHRQLVFQILNPMGFELLEASNGKEVITLWSKQKPDLILMDIRMPEMDGSKAAQKIRSMPRGTETMMIAVTASVFEEERVSILSAGFDDFIRKPFDRKELLEIIQKSLGIQYLYADSDNNGHLNEGVFPTNTFALSNIDTSALGQMPSEWLQALYDAALTCSHSSVRQLMDQIPEGQQSLSDTLTEWIEDFRYDKIVTSIERLNVKH